MGRKAQAGTRAEGAGHRHTMPASLGHSLFALRCVKKSLRSCGLHKVPYKLPTILGSESKVSQGTHTCKVGNSRLKSLLKSLDRIG